MLLACYCSLVAEGSDLRRRLGHARPSVCQADSAVWQREAISVGDLDLKPNINIIAERKVAEGSDLRRRLGLGWGTDGPKTLLTVAEGSDLRRRLGLQPHKDRLCRSLLWQREAISVGDLDILPGRQQR